MLTPVPFLPAKETAHGELKFGFQSHCGVCEAVRMVFDLLLLAEAGALLA